MGYTKDSGKTFWASKKFTECSVVDGEKMGKE